MKEVDCRLDTQVAVDTRLLCIEVGKVGVCKVGQVGVCKVGSKLLEVDKTELMLLGGICFLVSFSAFFL